MHLLGKFKGREYIASLIRIHFGVGQRCRAPDGDGESPALLPTISTRKSSSGARDEKLRRGSHRASLISVHVSSLIIVHVGVGQRCRTRDEESPASLPYRLNGHWTKIRGRQATKVVHASLIRVHVSVGQRCRASLVDVESPAILPTT